MNDQTGFFSGRRQQLIPHDDVRTILIEYYAGAYGPTLRVDIKHAEGLARFSGLFLRLASSEVRRAGIRQIGQVKLVGLEDIEMRLWPHPTEPRKFVEIVQGEGGDPAFRWTRYSEGWKEWAEMIEALNQPGHQYLTGKNQDDAIVEISFMEYPTLPNSCKVFQ